MAVDTAIKRFSMMGIASSSMKHVITDTTSGVSASERSTFIDLYSGIALDNPVAVTANLLLINRSIANYGGMRS